MGDRLGLVDMGPDLGYGLVARAPHSTGDLVARFKGTPYRLEEGKGADVSTLELQDLEEQHVARLDAQTVLVTTKATRQELLSQGASQDFASFAQHSPHSNVRLQTIKNELWLVANEDIAPGDMILLDYGKAWTGYHVPKGAEMVLLHNYRSSSKLEACICEERGPRKRKRIPNRFIFHEDNIYPSE